MQHHDFKKGNDLKHDIAIITNALQEQAVSDEDLVKSLNHLHLTQDEYQRIKTNYKAIIGALYEIEKSYASHYSGKINSFFTNKQKRVFQTTKGTNKIIRADKNFFNKSQLIIDKSMALSVFKFYAKKYDDKVSMSKKLNKLTDHHNARMGAIMMIQFIRSGLIKKSDLTGKDAHETLLLHNAFELLSAFDDKEWKKDEKYKNLYKILSLLKSSRVYNEKSDLKDPGVVSAAASPPAAMSASAASLDVKSDINQAKHESGAVTKAGSKAEPVWRYQLTPANLKDSNNTYILDVGVVYSRDPGIDPLVSLHKDFARTLKINHKLLKEFKVDVNDSKSIDTLLKQQFSDRQFQLLAKHYSQASSLILSAPMGTVVDAMSSSVIIRQPLGLDRSIDLYTEGNEVYVKSIAKRFPLSSHSVEFVGDLSGPLEIICKLTENGFEFQSLKTNSSLIRDIYLLKNIFPQRLQLEAIDSLLKEIDVQFQKNAKYLQKRKDLLAMRNILEKYWNGEVNIVAVMKGMEVLETVIEFVDTAEFKIRMEKLFEQIDSINQQDKKADYQRTLLYGTEYFPASQFPLDKRNQNLIDVKKVMLSAANFQVDKLTRYCATHPVFSTPIGKEALFDYAYTRMQDLFLLAQQVFLIRSECETLKVWSGMSRVSLEDVHQDELDKIEKGMIDALNSYSSTYLVGPIYRQIYDLLQSLDVPSSPQFQSVLTDCRDRLSNGEFDFEAKLMAEEINQLAERFAITPEFKNKINK